MAIQDYFTQTVSLITLSTGAWGSTGTRTTVASFPAAINPYGTEVVRADKKTVFADYKMYCDSSRPVTEKSVVRWDGKDFDVIFVKDTLIKGKHKRVLLKRQE